MMAEYDRKIPLESVCRLPPDAVYGSLPDWVIKYYIKNERIIVDPLEPNWEDRVDQLSINLRLGPIIKILKASGKPIDPRVGVDDNDYEHINLLENGPFIFMPDTFILAETYERIVLPNDIKGNLEGKSSWARIGTGVYVSAARFDPGWDGKPVMELTQASPRPVLLTPGLSICAFSFVRLMAPVEKPYAGRYKDGTVRSLVHKDNNDYFESK